MRETSIIHGVLLVICTLNLTFPVEAKVKYDLDSANKYYKPDQQKKHLEKRHQENSSKKFIGRIEHGKVKVLRRPEESPAYGDKNVCKQSKKQCNQFSEEEVDAYDSKKGKIKYSIKFRHEKQQIKRNGDEASIMRLHKNGRRYNKEDDDSSEEDDEPVKIRYQYLDDDD